MLRALGLRKADVSVTGSNLDACVPVVCLSISVCGC